MQNILMKNFFLYFFSFSFKINYGLMSEFNVIKFFKLSKKQMSH